MLLFKHFIAPSQIHGLGVFSSEFVPHGTLIWRFHPVMDRKISTLELSGLPLHAQSWVRSRAQFFPLLDVYVIASDGDLFMNHSDDPNMSSDGDECVALRDIIAGEEITCDYRFTKVMDFEPFLVSGGSLHTG